MVNTELVDYIQKALAAGRKDGEIKATLLQLGWTQQDVDDSLASASPRVMDKIRKEWKLVAVWIGIIILFIIVCALGYLAYTTPVQQ